MKKAAGIFLIVVGGLIVLGGLGMDTTKTTTSCYNSGYGSSCVETTYNDPGPQIAALTLGIGFLAVGGYLVRKNGESENAGAWADTPGSDLAESSTHRGSDTPQQHSVKEANEQPATGSQTTTFAQQLRQHQQKAKQNHSDE
jgi:hypothetical protein